MVCEFFFVIPSITMKWKIITSACKHQQHKKKQMNVIEQWNKIKLRQSIKTLFNHVQRSIQFPNAQNVIVANFAKLKITWYFYYLLTPLVPKC